MTHFIITLFSLTLLAPPALADRFDDFFASTKGQEALKSTKEDFHHYLRTIADITDAETRLRELRRNRDGISNFDTQERNLRVIAARGRVALGTIEAKIGDSRMVAAWGRAQMPLWKEEAKLIDEQAKLGGRPPSLNDDPHRMEVHFILDTLPPAYLHWGEKEQAPMPHTPGSSPAPAKGGAFGFGPRR